MITSDQMPAYSEAVKTGLYAKRSGLVGIYDNVRLYWEDETTRMFLRPALEELIQRTQTRMRGVRILDLGCGIADGYELLTGIRHRDAGLRSVKVDLLTPSVLDLYKGVDLNEEMLERAEGIYGGEPKMVFEQADFTQGLPVAKEEKPYDLYFASYGTCSHHNDDETLIRLLAEIAERVEDYCVIVCDWLGRYSCEWQMLWTNDLSENRNMDYVISYLYEKDDRQARRDKLQHLRLRLVSRQEAEAIIAEASKAAAVEIKPLVFFDRSTFTGRHMDTAEYNPGAQPIRLAVNSLHEANIRTDLARLLIDYVPKYGFDSLNDYFNYVQMCWNTLVQYVGQLLEDYDGQTGAFSQDTPPVPAGCPAALRTMTDRMKRIVEGVGWLGIGLPRENIIEPQLGYALRNLASSLQRGQGCAHSLVGIFEVDKR